MSAVSGNSNRMPPNMGGNQQIVLNFKIPVRKEQLCEEPADSSQFYVLDRCNINTISPEKVQKELERVADKLCRNGSKCLEVINNDYFDFLYSVIYYLDDQSNKIRKQIIQTLQIALKNLKNYIDMRKMQEYSENNLLTSHMVKN